MSKRWQYQTPHTGQATHKIREMLLTENFWKFNTSDSSNNNLLIVPTRRPINRKTKRYRVREKQCLFN